MDLRLKPLVLQLLSNRFRVLRRFPNARTRLDVQGLAARSFPSRLADRQTADRTFKGQRRHFAPERLPGPVGPQLLLAQLSSAGAGAPPASHGVPRASARPFRAANNPRSHCAATEAARGDARRGSRAERTGRRPWTPTCGPTPKRSPRGAVQGAKAKEPLCKDLQSSVSSIRLVTWAKPFTGGMAEAASSCRRSARTCLLQISVVVLGCGQLGFASCFVPSSMSQHLLLWSPPRLPVDSTSVITWSCRSLPCRSRECSRCFAAASAASQATQTSNVEPRSDAPGSAPPAPPASARPGPLPRGRRRLRCPRPSFPCVAPSREHWSIFAHGRTPHTSPPMQNPSSHNSAQTLEPHLATGSELCNQRGLLANSILKFLPRCFMEVRRWSSQGWTQPKQISRLGWKPENKQSWDQNSLEVLLWIL